MKTKTTSQIAQKCQEALIGREKREVLGEGGKRCSDRFSSLRWPGGYVEEGLGGREAIQTQGPVG